VPSLHGDFSLWHPHLDTRMLQETAVNPWGWEKDAKKDVEKSQRYVSVCSRIRKHTC